MVSVRTHNPRRVAARLLPLILLALGMALADLTHVVSPAPSPAPAALADAAAPACAGGACQPVMLAAPSGRQSVARARVPVPGDPGASRARDLLARFEPLARQARAATVRDPAPSLHDLPWRPARVTAAAHSTPRPPPVGDG